MRDVSGMAKRGMRMGRCRRGRERKRVRREHMGTGRVEGGVGG